MTMMVKLSWAFWLCLIGFILELCKVAVLP